MATSDSSTKVGIKATTVEYDKETDEYEIDLANVYIVALDVRTKVIRIKIKSDQIHQHEAMQQAKIAKNEMKEREIHLKDDMEIKQGDACETNKDQLQEIWDLVDVTTNEKVSNSESDNAQIQSDDDEIKEMDNVNDENKDEDKQPTNSFNILQLIGSFKPETNANENENENVDEIKQDFIIGANEDMDDTDTEDEVDEEPDSEHSEHDENEITANDDETKQENEQNIFQIDEPTENETKSIDDEVKEQNMPTTNIPNDSISPNQDDENKGNKIDTEEKNISVQKKAIGDEKVKENQQNNENIKDELTKEDEAICKEDKSQKTPSIQTGSEQQIEQKEEINADETKQNVINSEVKSEEISSIQNENKEQNGSIKEDETKENDTPSSDLQRLYDEVDDIDIAMNEIIEQNATKMDKHSSDTNDDSAYNKLTNPQRSKSKSSDTDNKNKNNDIDWRILFRPHHIKKKWISLMPKTNDATNEHFSCNARMFDECPCLQRLIFIQNNYFLFLLYKEAMKNDKSLQSVYMFANNDYPKTMNAFLSLLINYNKVRLMNDWYHIKRYHTKQRSFYKYFQQSMLSKQCITNAEHVCLQWNRNNEQNKEFYRCYSVQQRTNLYFITADSNIRSMSANEMHEINLQQFNDMIHSALIHKSISNGKKFTNKVHLSQGKKYNKMNFDDMSAPDTDTTIDNDNDGDEIVDAPNYIFGGFVYNYWDKQKVNFISAKYGNFKKELLQNAYYKMDKNDYNLIWYQAKDYIQSNEGRYTVSKRIREKSKINKIGKEIFMDHVMALIIYCNYAQIANKLKRGCKMSKTSKIANSKTNQLKHCEIVNWCRLLREVIYCFGDSLGENEYLYAHISCKLTFNCMHTQFNIPTSTTCKYAIAKSLKNANNKGICLKMNGNEKMQNFYFNVSNISHFPNEEECVIFCDNFHIFDVVMNGNGKSHFEELNVLNLYYQIIRGRFYTQNKQMFKKKNQREIIKFIHNMMQKKQNENYIQRCFESMTKNLRKNIIWINKEGLTQLLPELKQLFFNEFLTYLRINFNIKNESGQMMQLKINKEDIVKSTRENAIYSEVYKYKPVQIVNSKNMRELELSFRCYSKYDVNKQETMFKAEFVIKPFSKRIAWIRISGGLWFPQISFDKWDVCTFTQTKLTKGSSLFSLKKLGNINDPLIVNVCFQIKDVTPSK